MIPCILISYWKSWKLLVYFHGNGEDLGTSTRLMFEISKTLKCHVIGVEYPGYGVYSGASSED